VNGYVISDEFIKYIGIPIEPIKISKTKFLGTKVQKIFEELDKAEFIRLALNKFQR
jgi:hypothetical protein